MKKVKGKITSWNDDKGFGFISSMAGEGRIFVHIKAFKNRTQRPSIGDIVTYSVATDANNRPCAIEVLPVGLKPMRSRRKRSQKLPDLVAFTYLIAIIAAALIFAIPVSIAIIYIVLSIITFICYARDKSAAKSGAWRTSERTLHLFALIGGWPGALVAQNRLRHKSSKQPFRTFFWITVVINLALFVWLLTPTGAEAWQQWVNAVLMYLSVAYSIML